MDTFAAICSAVAAVASAVAAFLSFNQSKRLATQSLEAERRNLEHDIEETGQAIHVEALRALAMCDDVKQARDSVAAFLDTFASSGYSEAITVIEATKARVAHIQQQASGLALLPSRGDLAAADLAIRLPSLRTHLLAVRGIFEDAFAQRELLTAERMRLLAERDARRDREMARAAR